MLNRSTRALSLVACAAAAGGLVAGTSADARSHTAHRTTHHATHSATLHRSALRAVARFSRNDGSGPDLTGYTESKQSATYYGNGDVTTACDAALSGKGYGGGCFSPAAGATYIQASLADSVNSSAPIGGDISFQDASRKSVGSTIPFCGTSGIVKLPAGVKTVFVTDAGPVTNAVISKQCSTQGVGVSGTDSLTSWVPPATSGSTGSTGTSGTTSTSGS